MRYHFTPTDWQKSGSDTKCWIQTQFLSSTTFYRTLSKTKKTEKIYLSHPVILFLGIYLRTRNSHMCDKEIRRRMLVTGNIIWNKNRKGLKQSKYLLREKIKLNCGIFIQWNTAAAAAAVISLQSCPTLCDPTNSSPPGSSVPGILQVRILEWVAISLSNACMHPRSLQSCLTLCYAMVSSPLGFTVHRIL